MKLIIVDDHPVIRKGIKMIIQESSCSIIIDEANNASEGLKKISENNYDVAILDLTLPDAQGFEVIKEMKIKKPALPILILSILSEEHYAVRSLKAGASGYLTKGSAPDELMNAILKVSQGEKYISPTQASMLLFEIQSNSACQSHKKLSDREFQVLLLIASGKAVSEIAEAMGLSVKTVSTYRSRILAKMNITSNAEIIHYAIKHGLVN